MRPTCVSPWAQLIASTALWNDHCARDPVLAAARGALTGITDPDQRTARERTIALRLATPTHSSDVFARPGQHLLMSPMLDTFLGAVNTPLPVATMAFTGYDPRWLYARRLQRGGMVVVSLASLPGSLDSGAVTSRPHGVAHCMLAYQLHDVLMRLVQGWRTDRGAGPLTAFEGLNDTVTAVNNPSFLKDELCPLIVNKTFVVLTRKYYTPAAVRTAGRVGASGVRMSFTVDELRVELAQLKAHAQASKDHREPCSCQKLAVLKTPAVAAPPRDLD